MPKAKKRSSGLRARAEARVPPGPKQPPASLTVAELRHLMHELEVHKVELEIQNEELRAARGATEAALARYTELFDFAPIGYATLSADGVICELNHAGARLLGKARGRAVGAPFTRFVAAADRRLCELLLIRAVDSDLPPSCELALARPAGEEPCKVQLTASAVARGEHVFLLAFQDITERIEREVQLARTEQALREASRRKDEFLAMLSHELRNPLGPISGSLFILDHVEADSKQALDARAIIERQVTHLTRLIDDLLDVTRITRGKVELQLERVELAELVRQTIADHRAGFEARGIRLEARIAPGPFWLDADPARLVQIASNVLGNAEKFTPPDGTVTVSVERHAGQVALRVRDTGAGIAPELIERLFEPFVQAPQTIDRSRGGLGLGLAMVRGLVELHGGTVQLVSEGAGHGTEVIVLLPIAQAPAVAAGAAEAETVAPSRRVLVIDDNTDVTGTLSEALELLGHDVRIANRGDAGLSLARAFRPDVVICDLGLPEMDGYAVAAELRADPALRDVRLIALSGYARAEDRRRTAAAGFDHHVAKPAELHALCRLIAGDPGSSGDGEPGVAGGGEPGGVVGGGGGGRGARRARGRGAVSPA
jgi:PAS domain S-box-containing protein